MFIKFQNIKLNLNQCGSVEEWIDSYTITFPEWAFLNCKGEEWEDGEGMGWSICYRGDGGIAIDFSEAYPEYPKMKKFFS